MTEKINRTYLNEYIHLSLVKREDNKERTKGEREKKSLRAFVIINWHLNPLETTVLKNWIRFLLINFNISF